MYIHVYTYIYIHMSLYLLLSTASLLPAGLMLTAQAAPEAASLGSALAKATWGGGARRAPEARALDKEDAFFGGV